LEMGLGVAVVMSVFLNVNGAESNGVNGLNVNVNGAESNGVNGLNVNVNGAESNGVFSKGA